MNPEQELKSALEAFKKSATACAIAEAKYKDVSSQSKTQLAIAFSKTASVDDDGTRASANTREMIALWNPEYIKWEEGTQEANTKFIKWRAQKEIDNMRWETARSLISLEKSKINMI